MQKLELWCFFFLLKSSQRIKVNLNYKYCFSKVKMTHVIGIQYWFYKFLNVNELKKNNTNYHLSMSPGLNAVFIITFYTWWFGKITNFNLILSHSEYLGSHTVNIYIYIWRCIFWNVYIYIRHTYTILKI